MARQEQAVTIYEAEVLPDQGAVYAWRSTAALARGLPPEALQTFFAS